MLPVDELAQEIRRVDGSNSLGAGALAEALIPFFASREAEAGAVKVKPLQWEQPTLGQDEYKHVAQAHGCYFYYEIERRGNDRKLFTVSRSRDINCFSWAATIEEAMAAAQADYEQRILSALASPPASHLAVKAEDIKYATSDAPLEDAVRNSEGNIVNGNIIHGLQVLLSMTQWGCASPPDPHVAVKPIGYLKPRAEWVTTPHFVYADERAEDWQQQVFTIPVYASPPAPHVAEIPEGWGMFPKQPNPEMVLAGKLADQLAAGFGEYWDTRIADIYRAMLAAAPHHKQEGEQG